MQNKDKYVSKDAEITYEEKILNVPKSIFNTIDGIMTFMRTAGFANKTDMNNVLPISYDKKVPAEYCRQYNEKEYLLEIYKKIGITIIDTANDYYYNVILPKNLSIVTDSTGYWVKDSSGTPLIHYYDKGSFYDRRVVVDNINLNL